MRYLVVIASLMLISACADAEPNGMRVADGFRDNFHNTTARVKKWWNTPPPSAGAKRAVPESYCYHVYQDVLCYRQPIAGWDNRLAGYQGTYAAEPSTMAVAPLSAPRMDVETETEARVMNAKPVFGEMPAEIKPENKSEDVPPAIDASHEILPDPALAPQL